MPAPHPTDRSAADPRLHHLLRILPLHGVPVLPADYDRLERVLPPGRGLDAAAFEDTLVALLAKDETQRSALRREVRRCFPRRPAPGARTASAPVAAAGEGPAARPGPSGSAPSGPRSASAPPGEDPDQTAPATPELLVGRRQRRLPWTLLLAPILAAALALGLLPANLGQAPSTAVPESAPAVPPP